MSQQKTALHIGLDERLEASIEEDSALYVSGEFQGSFLSNNDLFIEKTGHFSGEAHVANAYIRGIFQGSLEASQQVFLYETSSFTGVLDCPRANISLGAKCCGEVRVMSTK